MTRASWLSLRDDLEARLKDRDPARAPGSKDLEELRVLYLGRKGLLTLLLRSLKDLSLEDRKELGPGIQILRSDLDGRIARRRAELESASDETSLRNTSQDLTLPSHRPLRGRLHPLTLVLREMTRILTHMGFSWADGPHAETEYYNFEALNIPEFHPARDSHDTFYLKDQDLLMRTHTSPVQIHHMESVRPPLRIISPGRVFRHDQMDATHSPVFHQVEVLAVDKNLSFADLKGTLDTFIRELLGPKTATRFRPSYFPFTEPSAEVDIKCIFCSGSGCAVCKRSGWIEMLGAGVVNPSVFKAVGYDPEKWSGFAFGLGVERLAMLRLGINDIRAFYQNDQRFLRQFDENIV